MIKPKNQYAIPENDPWAAFPDAPPETENDPWAAFPDALPEDSHGKAMGRHGSALEAAGNGFLQGMSFGLGDEAAGVMGAGYQPFDSSGDGWGAVIADKANRLISFPTGAARLGAEALGFGDGSATKDYEKERDWTRSYLEGQREEHPYAMGAGEIGGSVATAGGLLKAGATTARVLPNAFKASSPYLAGAATAAGDGAILGAAYGAGNANEGERLSGALTHGALGGVVGGGLGMAIPAAGSLFGKVSDGISRFLGRTSSSEAAEAAARLGVDLPASIATDNMAVQRVAETLKNVPGVGDPLIKSAQKVTQQLGQSADDIAKGYGAAEKNFAGQRLREAVEEGWTGKAEELSKKLYDKVDDFVDPTVKTPLTNTQKTADAIAGEYAEQGRKTLSRAVGEVSDSLSVPDGLTYRGVKGLRSSVGEKLKNKSSLANSNISDSEFSRLYGSLSDDLGNAAFQSGGEKGAKAFQRANNFHARFKAKSGELQKLFKSSSDEGVIDNIVRISGDKGNVSLLRVARNSTSKEVWDEVAGTVISRMGRKMQGEELIFSPETFLTEFGKITPQAKKILFGSTGKKDLVKALEDLSVVSSKFKELGKFSNRSGTAQNFGGIAIGGSLFGSPIKTISALVGGRLMANVLSKPATVRATVGLLNRIRASKFLSTHSKKAKILRDGAVRFSNIVKQETGKDINPDDVYNRLEGYLM